MNFSTLKRIVAREIHLFESRCRVQPILPGVTLERFKPPRPGGCDWYCTDLFAALQYWHGVPVPCVQVATPPLNPINTGTHVYMMAYTTDKGAVIIDPTIRQIYPDYSQPFFIGTADELREVIRQHGGPERPVLVEPSITPTPRVKDYYHHPEIINGSSRDPVALWNGQGEFTPRLIPEKGNGATHAERLRESRPPNKFVRG